MTEFAVAVADLARFCHRSGDIDHRFTPSATGPEGIAGHRRLYARRPDSYRREYPVAYVHDLPGLRLTLRGRADGFDPQARLVEEIKTCRTAPDTVPPAVAALHLAQGLLYAALIAREENLPRLRVRVTWLNIDSDEEFHREQEYTDAELAAFLRDSLERFGAWLQRLARLRRERDDSLAGLDFPYGAFRPGQRDIAELTYKCISLGGQLLLEAPTGLGKTAAVLFPALKALGTGKHERVVFVTAKTVGRRAAEQALARFRDAGYRGAGLSLTAKETVCLAPGRACHGDDCPYARGYYDKLPAALPAALERPSLTRQDIESLARQFEVCPYELASDLLPWVDTVIGDLHYVYSLYGALGAAMEHGGQRWTVLLDEAHNLPGRARGMFSARLSRALLLRAKRDAPGPVARALEKANRRLLSLQKIDWQSPRYHAGDSPPQGLLQALADFSAEVSAWLGTDPGLLPRHPDLGAFYFDSLHFLRVAQEWGPEYRCVMTRDDGARSLVVALNCLDPSRLLGERQARAHAVTAFSATLSPSHWTRAGLGLGEEAVCSRSPSPFAAGQLTVWLATRLDTRYHRRGSTLADLARLLRDWLRAMAGNTIVYFPSYRYMRDCLAVLDDTAPLARTLWVQEPGEGEERRARLLQLLAERRDLAAFCILGGIFGEGIDLPGEELSNVAVVGVGMPQVNRDTRELQDWYQRETGAGFEYTYLYPGMQKVSQALGRVVRSPRDRGNALLIDTRYALARYRQLLPPWWEYRDWPASSAE
jgi:DNA excision repair protein ERCC-2